MKKIVFLICFLSIFFAVGHFLYPYHLKGEVLRFHVLANSDSSYDQQLKYKVRDAVGAYMEGELKNVTSMEESREKVRQSMETIEDIAIFVVKKEGYAYPVSATLETTVFPEKTYGEFTFPAGEYEALRIVIGNGAGANWWCCLYPNMCFENSVYKTVGKKEKENLKEVVSVDEYRRLIQSKDRTYKSKLLEKWKLCR